MQILINSLFQEHCPTPPSFNMDPTQESQEEYSQVPDVTSSPVRGRARQRSAAPRPKSKEPKVKTTEGEPRVTKPRSRKAPEEGAPKVSKRAKSMVDAANSKIGKEGKAKSAKKHAKRLIESALGSLGDNSAEVYGDFVGEGQVYDKVTLEEKDFEVETIDEPSISPAPTSPLPASSPMVPWGPWCLSPADRSDGANASLIETEGKLKNYYLVTFEDWMKVPIGRHTKYTTVKRFGAKSSDSDFHERKVVHAVLGDVTPGDKPGRMCSGYKGDMAPWKRTNYETLNFYVQKGDLPSTYGR